MQGARGSPVSNRAGLYDLTSRILKDTVRDVRGFVMKFYTPEGIWDLVGNDVPVFFIQDAVKFPDLVHALKPEPLNEVPQGQTAHNNFWDFVGLMSVCGTFFLCHNSDTKCLGRSYGLLGHV